jgi:hypothetical protein
VKDLDVHTEKTPVPGFGSAALRDVLTSVTGLGADLPKTVGTGCGRRRPIAMTSMIPERITCLACREYAAGELRQEIASAESLLALPESSDWRLPADKREIIAGQAQEHRTLLARYAPCEQEK